MLKIINIKLLESTVYSNLICFNNNSKTWISLFSISFPFSIAKFKAFLRVSICVDLFSLLSGYKNFKSFLSITSTIVDRDS